MAKEDKDIETKPEGKAAVIDIERWFQQWFHNCPGISDNAEVWKRLQEAKQDLLLKLKGGST